MSHCSVTRYIHPIGQGAFYGEIIRKEDNTIHSIVYDCGSYEDGSRKYNIAPLRLIEEIANYSNRVNNHINVLFISHFHLDHINGVRNLLNECSVDLLVLPFLNRQERIFYFISNNIEGSDEQNPQNVNFNWYWNFYFDNVNGIDRKIEIASNEENRSIISSIKCSEHIFWEYIPILHKSYKTNPRVSKFLQELDKLIGWKHIDIIDESVKKNISDKWIEIVELYKTIIDDKSDSESNKPNENNLSLMLYSGSRSFDNISDGEMIIDSELVFHRKIHFFSHCHFLCDSSPDAKTGCLYTGDMELSSAYKTIVSVLGNKFSNINLLQISHHGSMNRFNKRLTKAPARFAFCCFGSANIYKHPDAILINEFQNSKTTVFKIDESHLTQFFQKLDFND